jgi:hypothetical protein
VKTIALEGAVLAALGIGAATLLSPRDAGLATLYPHPIWLAIALLATRYGSRGLAVGLVIGWTLTAFVTLVLGLPPALLTGRAASGTDLGALLGVVLVAWVASTHERRCADLGAKVAALKERSVADRDAVVALRATAVTLRARADRLDTSLTFLRDVAARLEGDDAAGAAQAALDLAIARIGARAGVVAAIDSSAEGTPVLVTLASCGTLGSVDPRADLTVSSALLSRRATRALDLGGAGNEASDLVAPIQLAAEEGGGMDEPQPGDRSDLGEPMLPLSSGSSGAPILGLIALRGVPQGGAGAAAMQDLALIAGWCARSLARREAPSLAEPVPSSEESASEGSVVQFNV